MSTSKEKLASTTSPSTGGAQQSGGFAKTLSIFDMVVYGLIFMVPIAPFSIYGSVFQVSNGMPALTYLIGLVGMVFSVLSFGVMIRRFPSSGSIYTYAAKGIGKPIGFMAGWLMLLQYLITPAIMYIMAGEALNQYFPQVPVYVWCLCFLAFVTLVSLCNIKATIVIDRVALVAELIVLALFLGFGIHYVLSHPSTTSFTATAIVNPAKFDFGSIMSAVSLAVLSFVGFGSVATLTEEAKNPRTGPSHAMMIMVIILGLLFMGMCYVATCVDPTGQIFANDKDNGFFLVAQLAGGTWLGALCAVSIALSLGIFTGLSAQTSVARILYVMGRSGSLPKVLGTMRKKTGTPVVAALFVSALSIVLLFVMIPLGMDKAAKVSNFGALSTYFILNFTVIWYVWHKRKERSQPFRHLVCPLIGAIVVFSILCSLGMVSYVVGIVWIVIGIVYYLIATRVFKKSMDISG